MMRLEPNWQRIPVEIKEDIVKYLNYKSRFRTSLCSKSDYHLIQGCPIFLEQVEVRENVLHIKDQYGSLKIKEGIFEKFFGLFKQKRSTVKSMILTLDAAQGSEMAQFFAGSKIRTKSVYFDFNGVSDQDSLRIFKIFDSKTISFRQTLSQDLVEELVKTETWKKAKQVFCYGRQGLPMDTVLHLESLRFFTNYLSSEDAQKIIDAYTTRKNLMPGFGFRINYSSPQVGLTVAANSENSYHFPTTSPNLTFVVKLRKSAFGNQIIEGYACTDPSDCKKFSTWTPEDHLQVNRRLLDQLPYLPPWGMYIRSMLFAADY